MPAIRGKPVVVPEAFDFAAAVSEFETPLLRYVRQFFGNDAESAEEVVQEAFLRLHRQVEQHGAGSIENMPSWLFRVAHNLTISVRRRRELERKLREQAAADAAADTRPGAVLAADALEDLVRRELCDLVMAQVRKLPDEQKQVLLLKVIQGFTLREIGEITGVPLSSVSHRINQGLRELAQRLKAQGLV
ncbi:MAG TPA: RNA polymerase sigma factor [Planctomycetota bacterium]|nr:RNA polymerase sigma factor [Planctomycetota bacterium]